MNSNTTTEILKLDFHQTSVFGVILFIILISLVIFYAVILTDNFTFDDPIISRLSGSILLGIAIILTVILFVGIFTTSSLTKKTETKTDQFNIVKVDNNLLKSNQLKITVKNESGVISTKEINVDDENTLIKVSNKDKIYTEKITKITYDTKQIFNSLFKKIPKDVQKKEITVYLPENLL